MTDNLSLTSLYRRLDLYHLLVLRTLLEERSTSLAAKRLSVTQSAVSKSLGRLREVFDDELFIRGKGQLIPTARARGLSKKLDAIFLQVNDVVLPAAFDPLTYQGTFTLSMIEGLMPLLLPPLLECLSQEAPGITLKVVDLKEGYRRHEESPADFLIGYAGSVLAWHIPGYQSHQLLNNASIAGLVRRGHPLAKSPPDMPDFLQTRHIRPRLAAPHPVLEAPIDYYLDQQHLRRQIWLDCNQWLAMVNVLQRSDAILVGCEPEVRAYVEQIDGLEVVDLSRVAEVMEVQPINYLLLVRETEQMTPPYRWLTQKIQQAFHQALR